MKNDRRVFCDTYGNEPREYWDSVMICDESTFRVQSKTNGGHFVRRLKGSNRYEDRVTARKFRVSEGVTCWAAFSSEGKCRLIVLPRGEMMRSERYLF